MRCRHRSGSPHARSAPPCQQVRALLPRLHLPCAFLQLLDVNASSGSAQLPSRLAFKCHSSQLSGLWVRSEGARALCLLREGAGQQEARSSALGHTLRAEWAFWKRTSCCLGDHEARRGSYGGHGSPWKRLQGNSSPGCCWPEGRRGAGCDAGAPAGLPGAAVTLLPRTCF